MPVTRVVSKDARFIEDFLEIVKRSFYNFYKIMKKCFLSTTRSDLCVKVIVTITLTQ